MAVRNGSWRVVLVLLVVGGALRAGATATEYTDKNSFLAGINTTRYLESFDSQPYGTIVHGPLNFSGNGFSYSASASGGDFYNLKNGSTSDIWISTQATNGAITLSLNNRNVTAVGGNVFATDFNGNPIASDYIIFLEDGTTVNRTLAGSSSSFEGFISSLPINSITFNPTTNGTYTTLNDFYVGTKLPEPSGLAVMLIAGMSLLSRRGKRRASRRDSGSGSLF
jgi:hypothetical protein